MDERVEGAVSRMLRKRDGRRVAFELDKISRAIAAAGEATGEFGDAAALTLADTVQRQLAGLDEVDVEQVQDRVEHALMRAGYFDTARAYIVYRERHGRPADLPRVGLPARRVPTDGFRSRVAVRGRRRVLGRADARPTPRYAAADPTPVRAAPRATGTPPQAGRRRRHR